MVTSFEIFHIYLVLRLGCYVYYLGGSVYFNILLNLVLIKDDSLAFCINNQQILGLMFIFLLYCSWKPRKSNSAHPKSTILKMLLLCLVFTAFGFWDLVLLFHIFLFLVLFIISLQKSFTWQILVNLKINPF